MYETHHLLLNEPYSVRATITGNHPQLRDLLVYTPEAPDSVAVVCYDSIARLDLCGQRASQYNRLKFSPSSIGYGCGLIAAGGQASELALMSADSNSKWCHQQSNLPHGCINNSIHIAPSLQSPGVPYVYVSNNDQTIKVYAVGGNIPDYRAAARRRQDKARRSSSRKNAENPASTGLDRDDVATVPEQGSDSGSSEAVEEQDTYDLGGPCNLQQLESATIRFDTAINHTSISRDGRRMVAVGDTNEIWLFDCMANGDYRKVHSFTASDDASFGTDWSGTGDKFAVSSQDGFVHVYDVRFMPLPGTSPSQNSNLRRPTTITSLKSSQRGPAGAARKVKFSPGSRVSSELLAFTEHRSFVQVVDARTFDQVQLLQVPPACGYPSVSSVLPGETLADFSPPPNPRPLPPSRARETRNRLQRPSRGSEMGSDGGAGAANTAGRPFIDGLYAERVRERARPSRRSLEPGTRTHATTDETEPVTQGRREAQAANNDDDDVEMGSGRTEIRSPHTSRHGLNGRQAIATNLSEPRFHGPSGYRTELDLDFDHNGIEEGYGHRVQQDDEDDDDIAEEDDDSEDCPPEIENNFDARARHEATVRPIDPTRNDYRWILPDPREQQREDDVRMMRAARSILAGRTPAPHITRTILSGYSPLASWAQPPRGAPSASSASSSLWSLPASTSRSTDRNPPIYFTSPGSGVVPNHNSSSGIDVISNSSGSIFTAPGLSTSSGAVLSAATGGYQPNSMYFPLESTPSDLLGLDWDDRGTSLFVATEGRVWEWRVDEHARRSFGAWDLR